MLEEARAAESRRAFISKCSIGLKEGREAWTRLRVCQARQLRHREEVRELTKEASELVAIVGAIVKNARRNAGLPPRVMTGHRPRILNSQL
jgi:four helix bundle protein